MPIIKSFALFLLSALFEIGGCYLIWLWLKEDKPVWYGLIGAVVLIFFGITMTLQPLNFARTCAAYGGIYIVLSLFWGYKFDNYVPDKYDAIGTLFCLMGAAFIYYTPRVN